ncbi:hypothetical protein BGX38DRAFT_1330668 [Terfezia claveryi]|nr:hypothetical protein BGX38DRAFT_1330668 [Terfezia claveryi]
MHQSPLQNIAPRPNDEMAIWFNYLSAGKALPEGRNLREELRSMQATATYLKPLTILANSQVNEIDRLMMRRGRANRLQITSPEITAEISELIHRGGLYEDNIDQQKKSIANLYEYIKRYRESQVLSENLADYITNKLSMVEAIVLHVDDHIKNLNQHVEATIAKRGFFS